MDGLRWRTGLLALALIACQLVSSLPYLTPDTVQYLSIARSLATHGTMLRLGQEQVLYAPIYPFLMTPLFWLGDEPFLALSFLNVALLAAFGFLVYRWCRVSAPGAALFVALLTVVDTTVALNYRRSLSETIFCPMLYGLAILYDRILAGRLPRGAWPFVVALQCAAALTRQIGIFLAIGFAIAALLQAVHGRRSWRNALLVSALAIGPPVLIVAAWTNYDNARATQFSNTDMLASTARNGVVTDLPVSPLSLRLSEGLRVRIAETGRTTIPGLYNSYSKGRWLDINSLVYLPVFALVLLGWRRQLRTGGVLAIVWPMYFLFHVYWPFDQSGRYAVPMIPFLFVCLWDSLERLGSCRRPLFAVLIAAHFAVSFGFFVMIDAPRARDLRAQWPALRDIADRYADQPLGVARNSFELQLPLEFFLDREVPVLPPDEIGSVPGRVVVEWDDVNKLFGARHVVSRIPTP